MLLQKFLSRKKLSRKYRSSICGSQGQADELAEDVQKREFLGLDAEFEFTTHFNFSLSEDAEEGSRKMLSWPTEAI